MGHRMITPEIPAIQSQTTAGTGGSMCLASGSANGDLVLPMLGSESPDITGPPRCGVMQYSSRTSFGALKPATQTGSALTG
jgi:hypothetical protein